jgi:hypothetical protein
MKVTTIAAATLCALLLSADASSQTTETQKPGKKTTGTTQQVTDTYVCPMHPDVTATAAGKCSKCGMALEKRAKTGETDLSTGEKKEMKKKADRKGCCEASCCEARCGEK